MRHKGLLATIALALAVTGCGDRAFARRTADLAHGRHAIAQTRPMRDGRPWR